MAYLVHVSLLAGVGMHFRPRLLRRLRRPPCHRLPRAPAQRVPAKHRAPLFTLPPFAPAFEAFVPANGAAVAPDPTTSASPGRCRYLTCASEGTGNGARSAVGGAEQQRAPYPRLRTVVLPQAPLLRFLAIGSLNAARDLERCGLPPRKEVVKGGSNGLAAKTRYVVETLTPEQHARKHTRAMDEEKGVSSFTEERGYQSGLDR